MKAPKNRSPTLTAITAGVQPARPDVPTCVSKYLVLVRPVVSVALVPPEVMQVPLVAFHTCVVLQLARLCAKLVRVILPTPSMTANTITPYPKAVSLSNIYLYLRPPLPTMNAPRNSNPTLTAMTAGAHPAKPVVPSCVSRYCTVVLPVPPTLFPKLVKTMLPTPIMMAKTTMPYPSAVNLSNILVFLRNIFVAESCVC